MTTRVADGLHETRRADGALAWTIDHPRRRNAITPDALRWIARRCPALHGDIVVLSGAGDGFCAGFDLSSLTPSASSGPSPAASPDAPLVEATAAIADADATFVVALHGFVIGAGTELASACDLRIAADDATFRIPAAALGVVYHLDGLQRLRAAFGPTLLRRMVLLGERIDAEDARLAGAVHRVVPRAALATTIDEVVQRLSPVEPRSLAANREGLRALDRRLVPPETARRHAAARAEAYARLAGRAPRPAKE